MLVLSRKIGESIQLGDNIRIEVTEVAGNRVRLAIAAPAETRVLRTELLEAVAAKSEFQVSAALDLVSFTKGSGHANSSSRSQRPAAQRTRRTRRTSTELCLGEI